MKSKFLFIIGIVILGEILSYFYGQLVVSSPQEKFKELRKMVYLEGKMTKQDFQISKDAYLLKIKHVIQENQPKEIFVNGTKLIPSICRHVSRRGIIETSYIYLPKEVIKSGTNNFDISFPQNRPPDMDIALSNYRKQIENDVYILFHDSVNLPSGKASFKTVILIVLLISLLFTVMAYFLNKIVSLNINRLIFYQIYSILPFVIFLTILWIGSETNGTYRVVISPIYFFNIGMFSFFITLSCIVSRKIWIGYRRNDFSFVRPEINKYYFGAREWIKASELADNCILLFMVLLMMCAFSLILHLEPIAEQLASLAYFALVIGVVIKFVKMIKEERLKK